MVGVTFIFQGRVKSYDLEKKHYCESTYTKMFLPVKDESQGREDDQIPSYS
jgi:hypothetical protein